MNHISRRLSSHQRSILATSKLRERFGDDMLKWPEDAIREVLTRAIGMPWAEVSLDLVDEGVFEKMRMHCRELGFLPSYQGRIAIHVFMPDPFHGPSIRALRNVFHREIHPIGTSLQSLERVMSILEAKADAKPKVIHGTKSTVDASELLSWHYTEEEGFAFMNRLVSQAYTMGTSDIFLEMYRDRMDIRFKIDGRCVVMPPIDQSNAASVMSQAKAFAGMSMRNSRGYRGGSTEIVMPDGNTVGFRAEAQKSEAGESMTLRLLDKRVVENLSRTLPFGDKMNKVFKALLGKGDGLILVSGPTGSGKTTTLWRCLLSLDSSALKIVTIEDPIEYRIDRFIQLPVKGKESSPGDEQLETFSGAVRSSMRSAPDVILVGEIRDNETAGAAIEASLTGHMILSTIHTPDTAGAIPRLMDKGQSALNIAQSLSAVVAQRLARRLCPECKIPEVPNPDQIAHFKFHGIPCPSNVYTPNGCPNCRQGIAGRVPVFEFLILDDELRLQVANGFQADKFRKTWKEKGGVSLGRNAMELAAEGTIAYENAASLDSSYKPSIVESECEE